ncbi:Serine protease trypsin-like protein [Phytophthora palmivora]|uniref:Serine protease trypsin-like protein n=1 Tax=Phytophthora palmivora TaxID=4796 RepID=A0A2P4X9R7_9STRA|nr:Serine protease trypsin-like protein [Phytophthora palmivora]
MTRDIRWAAVGAQSFNRTYDGEKIKVKTMLTHPNSTTWTNDFMVLELEKPSSVVPVALAAADDSDNQPGQWGDYIGWKFTQQTDTSPPKWDDRLQSAKVKIMKNHEWLDASNLNAGGLENEDPCQGNFGSPLVVEKFGQDVVVGLVAYIEDCNFADVPAIFTRVSGARAWIESATKNVCFA